LRGLEKAKRTNKGDIPKIKIITLTEIYNEKSRQIVHNYLKKIRITTRDWLLGLKRKDEETERQEIERQEDE
jgi:sulfur relay (sulfurtransferase) DsrF/TusC family protein